jgi:hypothetical protein
MIRLAKVLNLLSNVFYLQINHTKLAAFWIGGKKETRPTWNDEFKWTWAPHEAIFKLHGTRLSF